LDTKEGKLLEDVSGILFNLASVDRLTLLSGIGARKQRLKDLAEAIDASAQECSRHMARLSDSGFVKKDSEGFYQTTTLGRAVLSLFPSIQFLLRYRDSFLTHDLSFLPKGFVERIGELSAGDSVNHISLVLELIKTVISKGREYVWLISDQPIVVGSSIGTSFFSKDLSLRLVCEHSKDRKILTETKSALPHSEIATLKEVRVAMAINETFAGVCFPGLNGKIDFSMGFSGKDSEFRGWCSDLFEHYWAKSRKILI